MKPLKLKMCAFVSYADEETVDFSELGGNGLYLIAGETGSGKTTIFDAISYAIFGKASDKARSNTKMLRSDYAKGRTKTFVELDFSSGGNPYKIRREIIPHYSRTTEEVSFTDSVSLVLPDGTIIDKSRDVDAKITEIIGLDRDQFAQIVMIAQNDFLRFIQSGTDERVKILRSIFDTGTLKTFQERLKSCAKNKEGERTAVIRDFQKHDVDHNNARQQFAQWEQDIEVDNEAVRFADERLGMLDKAKEDFTAKIAVAEGLNHAFEEFDAQQTALEEHVAKAGEMSTLLQRHKRGEDALRKVKPFADKVTEAESAYTKAKTEFDTAKSNVEAAVIALQLAEKAITDLPPLEEAQSAFDELKQKWQGVSDRLSKLTALDSDYKDIVKKQIALNMAREELGELEKFIANLPSIEKTERDIELLTWKLERENEKCRKFTDLKNVIKVIVEKQNRLETEQMELVRINIEYASARDKYEKLYDQFILGQAGIIAKTLREGEPCPVCGSSDHPALAKAPIGDVSDAKLKELLSDSNNVKTKVDNKSSECSALLSEVAILKDQFMQDLVAYLPTVSWENASAELAGLITDTHDVVEKMTAKETTDKKALAQLKENWDDSSERKKELDDICIELNSSVSTLIYCFLKDFAELVPGVVFVWDDACTQLSTLLSETSKQYSELDAKKNFDETALINLSAEWERTKKNQEDRKTKLAEANALLTEREKREQESNNQHKETQELFASAIIINGFEDEAVYTSSLIMEDELAAISRQLAEYDEAGRRIQQDIGRLSEETAGKEKPDLEKLISATDELKSASEALRTERDETIRRLDSKSQILKELKKSADYLVKIEREYAAIKSLSDTANGRLDFETYAQMAYFERILRAANQRLKVMSQNRFVLLRKEEGGDGRKRMGLEIEVADSYTGKSRSANSLSGGELFMASLSLALGLSDVVQQSVGGISLDAMFIDEGFGSLDAEVLELAIRTLSNMAEGNRIIGIISHVAELSERIDKQICVEKTHCGSKIRLVVS